MTIIEILNNRIEERKTSLRNSEAQGMVALGEELRSRIQEITAIKNLIESEINKPDEPMEITLKDFDYKFVGAYNKFYAQVTPKSIREWLIEKLKEIHDKNTLKTSDVKCQEDQK